jgi:hypothetical protein
MACLQIGLRGASSYRSAAGYFDRADSVEKEHGKNNRIGVVICGQVVSCGSVSNVLTETIEWLGRVKSSENETTQPEQGFGK